MLYYNITWRPSSSSGTRPVPSPGGSDEGEYSCFVSFPCPCDGSGLSYAKFAFMQFNSSDPYKGVM